MITINDFRKKFAVDRRQHCARAEHNVATIAKTTAIFVNQCKTKLLDCDKQHIGDLVGCIVNATRLIDDLSLITNKRLYVNGEFCDDMICRIVACNDTLLERATFAGLRDRYLPIHNQINTTLKDSYIELVDCLFYYTMFNENQFTAFINNKLRGSIKYIHDGDVYNAVNDAIEYVEKNDVLSLKQFEFYQIFDPIIENCNTLCNSKAEHVVNNVLDIIISYQTIMLTLSQYNRHIDVVNTAFQR